MVVPLLTPLVAGNTAAPGRRAPARPAALVLGGLTGLLGLVAMVRLAAGAFSGSMSTFAWVVVLAAMLPWVGYGAWRAQHGRLSPRGMALVLALVVLGSAAVWLAVVGPVLALACSLAAFAVIWVADWPVRRPRGEDRLVSIEELQRGDESD